MCRFCGILRFEENVEVDPYLIAHMSARGWERRGI